MFTDKDKAAAHLKVLFDLLFGWLIFVFQVDNIIGFILFYQFGKVKLFVNCDRVLY